MGESRWKSRKNEKKSGEAISYGNTKICGKLLKNEGILIFSVNVRA
ncbi:hypothetical protein SCIP_1087 [Scardovia inopinata JCM 12537]|nr:hypothetical protein SCIP_1087 [Scardovia inopinata JCM 12537]